MRESPFLTAAAPGAVSEMSKSMVPPFDPRVSFALPVSSSAPPMTPPSERSITDQFDATMSRTVPPEIFRIAWFMSMFSAYPPERTDIFPYWG